MGETQGNMWTTMLFIILFAGMTTTLFWALDYMNYYSTVLTIEDNLKAENYDIFATLQDEYKPCGPVYDTDTDCSGIISIDQDKRLITYQISFDGLIMNIDAGKTADSFVLLPY